MPHCRKAITTTETSKELIRRLPLVGPRLKGIIHPAAGNARASRSSRFAVGCLGGTVSMTIIVLCCSRLELEHERSFHSVAEHQFHNGWGLQILPNGDYPLGCFTRMKILVLSLGMNDR